MLAASTTGAAVRVPRASAAAAPAVFNIASSYKRGKVQGLASAITRPTEFASPNERNLCGRNGEECELVLTTAKNFMQFLRVLRRSRWSVGADRCGQKKMLT